MVLEETDNSSQSGDLGVTWVSLDTRVTAATQRRKSWTAAQREMLV